MLADPSIYPAASLFCHPEPFAFCHPERSEGSRSYAQDKLREGSLLKIHQASRRDASACGLRMTMIGRIAALMVFVVLPSIGKTADAQSEWEKTLAAARKEGTLVVGVPASAELRKALESKFQEKFKISLELFPARGPENATRILNES